MTVNAPYALDNDAPTANPMHDCLSEILDDFTRRRLLQAGINGNSLCWEIGAGNGSVAEWMAEQIGPDGEVLATDLKIQHIRAHPGVLPMVHDVAAQEPPVGQVNLAHARLVFAHLPNRRDTLAKVASALAPGGAVVIEDWGHWTGLVLTSPIKGAAQVYARYQNALLEVFRSFGNDPTWAISAAQAMTELGLVGVDARTESQSWPGGSPGCRLPVVVSAELREPLLGFGATAADLDALPEIMNHPQTLVLGNTTVSTIGRRAR
ncbi:MAG TPA: class I SAM-dependent methyltransferase [Catenuloplanes sp.]|jgi:SAM-dependent methyltransferase